MLRLGLAGAARRAGVARAACAGGVGLPARRGMASVPYDKVVCERKTTDDSIKKFFRLTIESTIVATIMAFWWRSSHNAEKEKINRYYATLRAEMAAARAKEEAERHRAEADEAMKDMVRRQEEQAREKIAQAETAAIQEVRSMSVEVAMAAAEKLLADRLAGDEGSRLIDNSIEYIPRKLQ